MCSIWVAAFDWPTSLFFYLQLVSHHPQKQTKVILHRRRSSSLAECRGCQGARDFWNQQILAYVNLAHRDHSQSPKVGVELLLACQIWEAQTGRSKERWWWLWRGPHLWWHILLQPPVSQCKSHAPLNPRSYMPPLHRCAKKVLQLLHWKPVRYWARLHRHHGGAVCTSASFLQPEPVCVYVCVGFIKKMSSQCGIWEIRIVNLDSAHICIYSVLFILRFLSFWWRFLPYPTHQPALLGFWGYGLPCFMWPPICWE